MKAKAEVGKYFFGRHYNMWSLWIYVSVNENGIQAQRTPAYEYYTFEEALKKTYELNGWGEPKYINRKY